MFFDDLKGRRLIKQITHEKEIETLLNGKELSFYVGFDPTADSLHVGHLLQLTFMKRMAEQGHKPIALIGNATARIGDPTGKSEARKPLTPETVNQNTKSISLQISDILNKDWRKATDLVSNLKWIKDISFLDFISEIGKHFSVNAMLKSECFKSRMENGLSFLEFSYMLLQGFDFDVLARSHNCQLQVGGDDQWSNILAGIDLIHKRQQKQAFGLTLPLFTNAAGRKMGKTETGAIWLDPKKTSPFDFFQFWRNMPDTEIVSAFKLFTFIPLKEIEEMPMTEVDDINAAKKLLAFEMTKFVHGEPKAIEALQQAEALFLAKDSDKLQATPVANNMHVLDLIIKCGFSKSRTEARNLINGRGITINDEVLTDPTITINSSIFGQDILVRKGKKNFFRLLIKDPNVQT
jgi:tyrosyl-tRNA synthetase